MNILANVVLGLLLSMWIGLGTVELIWIYKKLKERFSK